jgi:hypothetical protein
MKKTKYTPGLMFTIGIMIVLIVVLVWRNNSAEGFFALRGGNFGTETTTYYIDVKYKQAAITAFASTAKASSISVDPRLTARFDAPITLDATQIIIIPIGNDLNHLPVNVYVYYASGNLAGNTWDNTPQYAGYSLVPGQIIKASNGNINITTLWSTLAGTFRYSGTWDTANKERTLARIYLTFLNS